MFLRSSFYCLKEKINTTEEQSFDSLCIFEYSAQSRNSMNIRSSMFKLSLGFYYLFVAYKYFVVEIV